MLAANIPVKISVPWGNSAGGSYIHTVPVASQIGITAGAASFTDGFPPLNAQPTGAGGVPPFITDFNGVLNQISAWNRWQCAGGSVAYDATFQTAVSGYPLGSLIASAVTLGLYWLSTVDGNTTNPDSGGAGWVAFSPTGSNARVITASGAFTTSASDQAIGLNRTASLSNSTTTLPAAANLVNGYTIYYEDLVGNFNAFPLVVNAPGGVTIAGLSSVTLNVNRQSARFRFYTNGGSAIWGVKV